MSKPYLTSHVLMNVIIKHSASGSNGKYHSLKSVRRVVGTVKSGNGNCDFICKVIAHLRYFLDGSIIQSILHRLSEIIIYRNSYIRIQQKCYHRGGFRRYNGIFI